ncbi:MAG: group II intron reverse transcriptase/maturase [Nitriliruptorales bacterium]|nr:group II intron reverse transcriptase/maturase [Nitriliruptorales bacterium]
MTTTLELADKLDAAIPPPPSGANGEVVVNGPQGETLDWHAIDWRAVEGDVRRLRQRIFTASQAGDLKQVRNLQKLMLRSRANTLLSVRRVTERNAGRLTAGIDGQVLVTALDKARLVAWVHHQSRSWQALPVKRVFIPKAGGKQRPLGIPAIVDRVLQARVVTALEPEWEARFEPRSYGFRPGRGCQDAISAIYMTLKGKNPQRRWVLDADLVSAFDRIDHSRLLAALGTFPARGLVEQWLKAGEIDQGRFAATEEGTPQGGVASPLLLNIALHGMEQAAGVRYRKLGAHAAESAADSPVLVRYADDLIALCHSREQALEVKAALAGWLAPRGLAFNEDKTQVVSVNDGVDFLGFNVRRYNDKLLIKPSPGAVRRIRERLRAEMQALRGANAAAVLRKINPIVRGWSAYYRTVVSSATFTALDNYVWRLTYRWAVRGHRNKPTRWVIARHFGRFNRARSDRWVFGDRDSGAYLHKFSWTRIVRHQMVKGTSSPDDPSLTDYWAERRRKGPPPPLGRADLRRMKAQDGRCPVCGGFLLYTDHEPQSPCEWEQWLAVIRQAMTKQHVIAHGALGTTDEVRLIHGHCHRRHAAADDDGDPALLPAREPSGLA